MNDDALRKLLDELLRAGRESEWVELKENNTDPAEIGEYISALANAACLHDKPEAYVVWGIQDGTLSPVGTAFKPREARIGNEELENWLSRLLRPGVEFRFYDVQYQGHPLVVLVIPPASHTPVQFKGVEYIRIGTVKRSLKDVPEKQRELWRKLSLAPFEQGVASTGVSDHVVLDLIDYPKCFELLGVPLPDNRAGIISRLQELGVIRAKAGGLYDITNPGAVLFAKDLQLFDRLGRKAVRVIVYKGRNRLETRKEHVVTGGYAIGFEGLIDYVNDQLPANEEIHRAFRKQVRMYPEVAIRELTANMLIHQDFGVTGAGPTIEIFEDRIEFTNPGEPLVDTMRFLDMPPRSRNEALAALMRRMNFCEERGSGVDKIVFNAEVYQLPAPSFERKEANTVATLYAHQGYTAMGKIDRIRACYLHACLKYVSGEVMSNTSLRERFGVDAKNHSMVSRLIAETARANLIRQQDPENTSKKWARYIPYWA